MSCKPEPGLTMLWITTGSSLALYFSQNPCLMAYLPPASRDRLPFSSKQFHWEDVDSVRNSNKTLTTKRKRIKCVNMTYMRLMSYNHNCTVLHFSKYLRKIMLFFFMFCLFRSYCSSQIWHRKDLRVHHDCFGLAYTGEHSDTGIHSSSLFITGIW